MTHRPPARWLRCVAALLLPTVFTLGCPTASNPLRAEAGWLRFQEEAWVSVAGVRVNAIGGNLALERTDLSIDTRLGRQSLAATYNSTDGAWRWNFELRYDGQRFVDASGAEHDLSALPDGATVAGTDWMKVDGDTVRTRGGLLHHFDATGRLARTHWLSAETPSLEYVGAEVAGSERTVRVEQCLDATDCRLLFDLARDGDGRVVGVTDRAGRQVTYDWDAQGRLAAARDALDVARQWSGARYEYDGTLLVAITNSEGERVEVAYNGRKATQVTRIGGSDPEHRFHYEGRSDGLYTTRSVDPTGVETRFRYDAERRLAAIVNLGADETTSFQWSERRRTGRIDPAGVATFWTYAGEEVATRTDPSGNVLQFAVRPDAENREAPTQTAIAWVADDVGLVMSRVYDSAGRLTSTMNGAGELEIRSYDAEGMLASTTRGGVTRSFSGYGEHGHATRVTVDGAQVDRVFDAVGNRVEGPGENGLDAGGIHRRHFDEDRNLTRLELAQSDLISSDGETIELDHRSDGQLVSVTRGGADHRFQYDVLGRLVRQEERVDGVWQATHFEWDDAGRQVAIERANGMRQEWRYGPDGRLAAQLALRDGALEGAAGFGWASGRLVERTDSITGKTQRFHYDGAGRVLTTDFDDGDVTQYGYDLRSRRNVELFVEDGAAIAWIAFGYDGADRIVEIEDPSGVLVNHHYEDGRVVETGYGNGVTRSYGFGPAGELVTSDATDAGGNPIEQTTIGIDDSFVLQQVATTTTFGTVSATTEERYWITADPEAPNAPSISATATAASTEFYGYDARSNLRVRGGEQFEYNAERNRLVAVRDGAGALVRDYHFDAAGFVVERGGVPLTWSSGGNLLSHGPDRIERDALDAPISVTVGGLTTRARFGGRIVADAANQPLAIDLEEVRIDLVGGGHRYRHRDFRGNVKFTTNGLGEVDSHIRYDAWGVAEVHGSNDDALRFQTRAEFGSLVVMGARIYDPEIGRFLSPDPLFQIVNQYAYTLSNPVGFEDRSGMSAVANVSAGGDFLSAAEAIGSALVAIGAILVLSGAAGPGTVLIAIGSFILFLVAVVRHLQGVNPSSSAFFANGGELFATGGTISGPPGPIGCAPSQLGQLPDPKPWMLLLLLLQLVLGVALLRSRPE